MKIAVYSYEKYDQKFFGKGEKKFCTYSPTRRTSSIDQHASLKYVAPRK